MKGTAIVCVENGKEYSTQMEAARELGVGSSGINRVLQDGGTVRGLHFIYKDSSYRVNKRKARRPVICLETGTRYESAAAAAAALGVVTTGIFKSVSMGCMIKGHHFYYADKPIPPSSFFKRLRLKIRCNETGEVYDSVRDAAKAFGINPYLITGAAEGAERGFTWSYVTEGGDPIEFPDLAAKQVEPDAELQSAKRKIAELQSALESERREFRAYKAKVARHVSALSKELDVLRELSQEGGKQVDDH